MSNIKETTKHTMRKEWKHIDKRLKDLDKDLRVSIGGDFNMAPSHAENSTHWYIQITSGKGLVYDSIVAIECAYASFKEYCGVGDPTTQALKEYYERWGETLRNQYSHIH